MNNRNPFIPFIYLMVFVYIFVMYVLLIYNPEILPIVDYSLLLSTLLTVFSSWYVVNCYGKNNIHATSFRYMFVGSIAIFLADLAQTIFILYYPQFSYPYPTDFFYAVGYVYFLSGIIREISNYGFFKTIKKIKLYLGVSIICLLYIFYIYLVYDYSQDILYNATNIIFRTGDFLNLITVLIIVRITYEFRKSQMFKPWLFVLIGIVSTITEGVLYNLFYENYQIKQHYLYNFIDLFWAGGYILVSYGFYQIGSIIKDFYQTSRFKINFFNKISKKYGYTK